MKIYSPFTPEIFPENIIHMIDNDFNRQYLNEKIGNGFIMESWDKSYIVIDTEKKTWRTCPTFEWLYRNPPPTMTIEEFEKRFIE